ncbi:MAG TPA: diacylglycerol kinase family protein [Dissulfurispiraceae bacterium]|nr:diacylglycerol kinase family protein [Dissulfurispiraceae bacterium]
MNREIPIICNPVAGGFSKPILEKTLQSLRKRGFSPQVNYTERRGDGERIARAIAAKLSASGGNAVPVIAAGGDGTYNEVAQGLAYTSVPMAILPLGTTSVLAREIGIGTDVEKAIDLAVSGLSRTVHMGRLTDGSGTSRYFLLMAGIGFDGEAVARVGSTAKRRLGKLAYVLSGLRTLAGYRPGLLDIRASGVQSIPGKGKVASLPEGGQESLVLGGYAVIAGKSGYYGGDFRITPDAALGDPGLYVFITQSGGRIALLRYASAIVLGKHLMLRDIRYFRAERLSVSGTAAVQVDGDPAGATPVHIDVAPGALRLACW